MCLPRDRARACVSMVSIIKSVRGIRVCVRARTRAHANVSAHTQAYTDVCRRTQAYSDGCRRTRSHDNIMHISIVCPSPPTWKYMLGNARDLSFIPRPMGGANRGIRKCVHVTHAPTQRGQSSIEIPPARGDCSEALAFSTPCSTMKTILLQYGSFNRLVEVDCSPEKAAQASERTLLIQEIRQAFGKRISSEDRITLQLKHVEWDGVFVDYFGEDKSMMRLVVEKVEVS